MTAVLRASGFGAGNAVSVATLTLYTRSSSMRSGGASASSPGTPSGQSSITRGSDCGDGTTGAAGAAGARCGSKHAAALADGCALADGAGQGSRIALGVGVALHAESNK